jgi:iron complex outermembrane receptor protein
MPRRRYTLAATASLLAFAAGEAALAQQAPLIEEVVVTARRREEALQSVPLAITAVTGDDIRARGISSVSDLRLITPSLNVTAVRSGQENFTIRGQGPGPLDAGAYPGVQTYFAEVPAFTAGPGLYYDLQSVQVLKGPQGTLFGRNVLGGAVLFQPRKPTDTVEGYIQGTFGSHSRREGEGALNVPVVADKLKLRLAGIITRRHGYDRNITTGQVLDPRNYESGRASVTFTPTEAIENYTVFDYFHQAGAGQATILEGVNPDPATSVIAQFGLLPTFQALLAAQQARGIREAAFDANTELRNRHSGITNITTVDVAANLTVKNILGYRENRQHLEYDLDGTPLPLLQTFHTTPWWVRDNQFTEELQLQGKSFDDRLTWIAGGYYEKIESKPILRASTQFFQDVTQRPSALNISRALFAQGTYDLSSLAEGLKVTAGFRYTWDRRSAVSNTFNVTTNTCTQAGADSNCQLAVSGKFKSPTWNFSLDYQVTPTTLAYVATRRGYKSGGLNAVANDPRYINYGPEKVIDVEVGAKSDFTLGDVAMRANAALYHTWNKDRQFQGSVLVSGQLVSLIQSAGKANTNGAELELTAVPVEGLQFTGFYSYTRFKLEDPTLLANNVPNHKVGITGTAHLPVPETVGDLVLTAPYSYQSKVYMTASRAEPFKTQPGYSLVNMNLDLNDIGGMPVDAGLFVTNLTNKAYRNGAFPLYQGVGISTAVFGEPRMWGGRLRYRFGG